MSQLFLFRENRVTVRKSDVMQLLLLFEADLLVFWVCSEKLRIRQTTRRRQPPTNFRRARQTPEEPFFTETGKNALIITGGWLVSLFFTLAEILLTTFLCISFCSLEWVLFSQNEILYEKKKKRRRLRLHRLGRRPPSSNPGEPLNDWEKEMRQVKPEQHDLLFQCSRCILLLDRDSGVCDISPSRSTLWTWPVSVRLSFAAVWPPNKRRMWWAW